MQVVIALPASAEMDRLDRPICGVPLLTRVVAAAARAGATRLLLIVPPEWPIQWLNRTLRFKPIESLFVDAVAVPAPFDANDIDAWRNIAGRLDDQFLWLPCDYLAHRPELAGLVALADVHSRAALRFSIPTEPRPAVPIFEQPAVLLKKDVVEGEAGTYATPSSKASTGSPRGPQRAFATSSQNSCGIPGNLPTGYIPALIESFVGPLYGGSLTRRSRQMQSVSSDWPPPSSRGCVLRKEHGPGTWRAPYGSSCRGSSMRSMECWRA